LDSIIYTITQGAGLELTDSYVLFLDQVRGRSLYLDAFYSRFIYLKFIAVLKLLLEKAQAPLGDSLSSDISLTLSALACFITRFNTPACYRIKIKFCVLCDHVCEKTNTLTFRKDQAPRHDILDLIMEWIQDPANVGRSFHLV
jgi:hypothetical protein